MKAKELLAQQGELHHKIRTTSDLIRHIKTKEERSPANYSLFLGAGASVTSGIKTASSLIEEWSIELYERFVGQKTTNPEQAREYFEKNHPGWFNPANPYSSLFEKKFDLPVQRRRFVESEVDKKLPSIGYAYLSSLVDNNFFNTIFTTNFDDLINEAFYLFSNERPIQCAHDSSVHSISITSKRPKIIKLHGDYLFDNIKSTLRETESLEQNTKEKFVEFSKEYGLIVVGYSGSDRSIMDVLEFLVKQENYLKNGIYWCLRPDDNICHALRNMLWKDKVYPVMIDGFDELFAEIHEECVARELNLNTNTKQSKAQQTIKSITEDKYQLSHSSIIKKEIELIKNDEYTKDISEFIKELSTESETGASLGTSDLRNFLEIGSLLEKNQENEAYDLCETHYKECKDDDIKPRYIQRLISIAESMDNSSRLIYWCDRLIETDPNNISYRLQKSRHLKIETEKYQSYKTIAETNRFSTQANNAFSKITIKLIKKNKQDRENLILEAEKTINHSLNIDPSLDNPAWEQKQELLFLKEKYSENAEEKKSLKDEIDNLLKKARTQHPEHTQTLELTSKKIAKKVDLTELDGFLSLLYSLHKKSSKAKKIKINSIINESLSCIYQAENNLSHKKNISFFFETHLSSQKLLDVETTLEKCRYQIDTKHPKETIRKTFESILTKRHLAGHLETIIEIAKIFEKDYVEKIKSILAKEKSALFSEYYFEIEATIAAWEENYIQAEDLLRRAFSHGLPLDTYLGSMSFIYLKNLEFDKIIVLAEDHSKALKDKESEVFLINSQYAFKKIAHKNYNEVLLRNMSAQSDSDEVKLCAFHILGNENETKRLLKKQIDKSYLNYFRYLEWPILNKDLVTVFEAEPNQVA